MSEGVDCAGAMADFLEGTQQLGISLTGIQESQFRRYCEVLQAANSRTNLTGIRTAEGIMQTLFLDSLTIAPALPAELKTADGERTVRVVDVGSGAGIPGLPLKILFPWWSMALVESIGKKVRFLEEALHELGLEDTAVLQSRAEELAGARPWRDSADLCLARAVAPLPVLVELCSPFVRPGGLLAFPKSGDIRPELEGAKAAMKALRVELHAVMPVPIELGLGPGRVVVLYHKYGSTPAGYPRRVGLARTRPIGSSPGSSRSNP